MTLVETEKREQSSMMERLHNDPIPKLLKHYAVPSIVGQVVNSLYNVVDRIYIGQGVNSLAISGLAITFPTLIFLQAMGVLVGVGAASRISILLGQKRVDTAEEVLGNAVVLTFMLSLTTATLFLIFLEPLLYAFGATEATLPYAWDYLVVVIPGNIFANMTYSYNNVMRATGYPKKAMITMMIGAVLNIVLNPIFLFVFDMGIQGVAWATVISMFVTMIWVLSHFYSKKSLIRIRPVYFKLKKRIVFAIISIGLSPFFINLAASGVSLIRNNVLLKYGGDYAVGAYGIINSTSTLMLMVVFGLAFGMQPIVGYNYGSGLIDRVKEALYKALKVNFSVGLVATFLALFVTELLVRAFTQDRELIEITVPAMQMELSAMWGVGVMITITHFFQSIGLAWRSILLSLSRQILFLIPLMLLLPRFWGLNGAWIAAPISDVLALTLSLIMLYTFLRDKRKEKENSTP